MQNTTPDTDVPAIEPAPSAGKPTVLGRVKTFLRSTRRLVGAHWLVAALLLAVILLGTGSAITYHVVSTPSTAPSQPTQTHNQTTTNPTNTTTAGSTGDEAIAKAACSSSGRQPLTASWLGKRTKLADLGVFSYDDEKTYGKADVAYYHVGSTTSGNAVIMATAPSQGPGGDDTAILVEDSPGHYLVLARHSNMKPFEQENNIFITYKLATNAAYDIHKEFTDLCVPDTLAYKDATLNARSGFYDLAPPTQTDSSLAPVALEQHSYGTLYEYTYTSTNEYKLVYFVVAMHDTRYMRYDYPTPLPSSGTDSDGTSKPPKITWSDGSQNSNFYYTLFVGCGSGGTYEIAKSLSAADLVQIGTGANNKPLYGFASTSNPLFVAHYQDYLAEYKLDSQGNTPNVSNFDKSLAGLSAADWQKQHPIVVVPDGMGRYIVLLSDRFSVGGGCGKPVIYLYPTKPTTVTVRVGAEVQKSEPQYGDGWRVYAQPSGALLWNGLPYSSLYWEGIGHGMYPLANAGTVVPQAKLTQTLTDQLIELGLTSHERNDFLAFWLPRLPHTPYVRLTWFNTEQMNQLAPLAINPRPDTLIRVFLDYQGLEQPISLPSQQLRATPRSGFTVVEWGGILH